ncbi:MAG TPA: isoprenylcysteine carboxylmethyltransferase family protein [Bacteroidota bacterium]|nr:isoprenylcysteine carboxylmethyltransferase family protein [Bacteroidota bacterium]
MTVEMIKLAIFIVLSIVFVYLSRKSILIAGSHGFYRFFAAEAIIALVLSNVDVWFTDPLSLRQIASWLLLFGSLVVMGIGFLRIRHASKPGERRSDATLLEFEKTTSLVTTGIYTYLRHPMYTSLLYVAWGVFLKEITASTVCLVIAATWFLNETAKADEAECIQYFGEAYKQYMTRTKRFIPFIY